VHHSRNKKYLDKNFDQHLLSGTDYLELFKQRKKTLYGITTPINSYNPITLNFHEWKDIFLDVIKVGH
jgi:hypothetical protein